MRMFLFAMKNLTRYKRRTLITALALAFGIVAYIFTDSMLAGAETETERNFRLYETGDSIIVDSEYWEERTRLSLTHTVEGVDGLTAQLVSAGVPTTPRVRTKGELVVYFDPFPEDGSLPVQFYGIDLATHAEVFDYHNTIVEGEWFSGEGVLEVVIGGWLAEDIGAEVGWPVTLSTQTKRGFRQTIDATIVGIMNSPNPVINRRSVLLPRSTLDTFLQLEGSATELVFPVLNETQRAAAERVVAEDAGLAYIPFETLAEEFFVLAESESSGNSIMLFVIFIIAAVGVSNTMLMAVLERSREIGMLQAIGMSRRQIYIMFLYEAMGIGLLGGLLGVVGGALANIPLVEFGINYEKFLRDFDFGYRLTSVFRGTWRPTTFIGALYAAMFISVATAYFPIRRILRRRSITDNLRAH